MSDTKIIAVVGATGAQGGGLVRAIQSDPAGGFKARALTRNVDSEKARALAELGAEVVAADVDDPASVERAFAGAYGAFCVTFFWEHFSPEKEQAHVRARQDQARHGRSHGDGPAGRSVGAAAGEEQHQHRVVVVRAQRAVIGALPGPAHGANAVGQCRRRRRLPPVRL